MRILGKILAGFLWVLLLLAALFLLTALAWWLEWPLITGPILLAGIVGLFLAFFGLRAFWRWRDKRRFVSKVMDEQARQEEATRADVGQGRVLGAWNQGMHFLKRSPLRFQELVRYGRPWFVTLDAAGGTGSADVLFSPFGTSLPEQPDDNGPLTWHFAGQAVLLRCKAATDDATREDWEELLTLLAKRGRGMPLRGMIAVLDARTLLALDNEGLRDLGLTLRGQAQQLMLSLNRRHPLIILVQGLEDLPGMDEVLPLVGPEALDAPLGLVLRAEEAEEAGLRAAEAAASRLEEAIRVAAAAGDAPKGDMLRALDALRALGLRLQTALDHLFRDIAHQARPEARGVFFCESRRHNRADPDQGQPGDAGRPRFLSGLLGSVLPGLPHPPGLRGGLPFVASTRALLMAAWLTLLFFVCGLFAVNALYQRHVLGLAPEASADVSHDATINELYGRMNHARRLEKARRVWRLPTFGQNMLGRVEAEVKRRYVLDVNTHILAPMMAGFRTELGRSYVLDRDLAMDIARELVWLCDTVSDRITKGTLPPGGTHPFPLTRAHQDLWTPVIGELLTSALEWIEDGDQLKALAQDMQGLLSLSLGRKDGRLLDDFLTNVNRLLPAAEICLSQFWPHIDISDDTDVCMPPAYTAAGYEALRDTLEDIESIARENQAIRQRLKMFQDEYFRDYASRWRQFIDAFGKVRASLLRGDLFDAYAETRRIEDMPHVRLFLRLAAELAPLENDEAGAPTWAARFTLHNTLVNIALTAHQEGAGSRLKSLFAVASTSPKVLQRLLNATHSAKELRDLFRAADELRQFFNNIVDLLHMLQHPAQALDLAKIHYGGPDSSKWTRAGGEGKGGPSSPEDDEDLYSASEDLLVKVRRSLVGEGFSPVDELLTGMLDFIAQGCTVQTARILQREWENAVLGSPVALYRQDNVEAIHGDKGLVRTFADERLKPFLTRSDKAPAAARWKDLTFPFTNDFLALLSHSELVAASPPQDTFYVQLRSQPTLVNPDARERPEATELRLRCGEREAVLVNRNYPRDERFQYTIGQCGKTELSIRFPSFTLDKTYKGFVEFLQEFQDGKKELTAADFPDAGERFAQAGLKTVTVRILPDNVIGLFKQTGSTPPPLPDRITYTW